MHVMVLSKNTDMKKKISSIEREESGVSKKKKLTRKEAIKKSGYMALSAATMMILLPIQSKGHEGSPTPAAPTNSSPGKPDRIWDN